MSSVTNEKNLLALLMRRPTHMRALDLDTGIFADSKRKHAADLIKSYVQKYKTPPTISTLKRYVAAKIKDDVDQAKKAAEAIRILKKIKDRKIPSTTADFEFEQAANYSIGRSLISITEDLQKKFDSGDTDYAKMRQDIMSQLLKAATAEKGIRRGALHKNIKERLSEYNDAAAGKAIDIVPTGMSKLDSELGGGIRKTFVTLFYSKTGGGKTRTAVNIAYNAAKLGYRVMYFSFEMAFNLIASCFDSRMAWVDGKELIFGKLSKKDKKLFKKALKKQIKEKLNIYLVDISGNAQSSVIAQEIEYYYAAEGVAPDLVIVDYANLVLPMNRYGDRSERYDVLFQEFHQMAKYYNVGLITMTQESRESTKAEIEAMKKKRAHVEQGVHNIGLSHYMAPHCEAVIRLKQTSNDRLQNRIWAIFDKSRYGAIGTEVELTALWSRNYVGDRTVRGHRVSRSPRSRYAAE